jgi:hypothetical protein
MIISAAFRILRLIEQAFWKHAERRPQPRGIRITASLKFLSASLHRRDTSKVPAIGNPAGI